jgi:uncharacterized protein (TIRG00374 family)
MNERVSNQDDSHEIDKYKTYLNKRTIRRGIVLFVTISVIAFIAVFLYNNTGKTVEVLTSVKWYWIVIGLVFTSNDLILGGLRNHIFIREFKPGISFWVSVKANLANIFMGAVTPSQSGGGPGQIYIFYRHGVSIPDNISNSFFNWISTIIFFPLSGWFAINLLQDKVPEGLVTNLSKFGMSVFTTLFFVILIGLLAPSVLGKFITFLGKLVSVISTRLGEKLVSFGKKAEVSLTDYRNKCVKLISTKPQLMLMSFVLTIILYGNKYLLAYIILLSFGLETDFWTVIAIQAVLYLLLYFSPSPGGSGIAELSISGLMASVISQDYITSFTLLYRTFLIFIPAILGSIVVLDYLKRE